MPRENKTKYAVLGLLTYAPLSGYDIRRIYADSLGNFWSESYGAHLPDPQAAGRRGPGDA